MTICTNDRKYLFGDINNDEMLLNKNGEIAERCWLEMRDHFNNIELNKYIIMPNHLHGIIIVGYNDRCANCGRCANDILYGENHINDGCDCQRDNHGCSLHYKIISFTFSAIHENSCV